MEYFDPSRPRLPNGVLQYVDLTGKPVAAVPNLTISVKPDGYVISTWLPSPTGTHHSMCNAFLKVEGEAELICLLVAYRTDPEAVLRSRFGWSGSVAETKAKVQTLSIDDLL